MYSILNSLYKLFLIIDKKYEGYERLDDKKCYKQIIGPHPTLNDAMQKCNELEKHCNGIQFVKCTGNHFRITKSLLDTPCSSEPQYMRNPNCDIIIYEKGTTTIKNNIIYNKAN